MRIFISAGEPSGDMHGSNLIRAVQALRPDVEFVGFGGEGMEAAGCRLLYPLCRLSVMWLLRVFANLHVFLGVLSLADRYFRHKRPDAVVLIDYPGLHWWLARRAHFHGIPVFYFVPPQIWAWGSWRVKKMQRFVDHVLCTLPFEEAWYRERGVSAYYVGHPYFDAVQRQQPDAGFVLEQRQRAGRIVALLPGSRGQEVAGNFPTMLKAVQQLHVLHPETRFLVACFKKEHQTAVDRMARGCAIPLDLHTGKTAEIIHLADVCLAVSGSVSLELLHHLKPTVILYRVGRLALPVGNWLRTSKYITLVNLLADEEIYPEFLTDRCVAGPIADQLHRWLSDDDLRQSVRDQLRVLREQVGKPGACEHAAQYLLADLESEAHEKPRAAA